VHWIDDVPSFTDAAVITEALQRVACARLSELSFVPATAASKEQKEASVHARLTPVRGIHDSIEPFFHNRPGPTFAVEQLVAIHGACPALPAVACDVYVPDEAALRFTGLALVSLMIS
jgi:hypothetical protein